MDYGIHLTVLVLIWATLALSQGFLTGYLGVLAVHQAAAWGVGAYTAALLSRAWGIPLYGAIMPAGLVAGVTMLAAVGLVSRGRRDDQVLASLCLQMVVIGLITNLSSLTGGPLGIVGIGTDQAPAVRIGHVAIAASAVLIMTALGSVLIARSNLAASWIAARDDRAFAESLGIDVGGARRAAAFTAAAAAGAAGAIYAHFITFVEPGSFGLGESVALLAIAIIGGAPRTGGVLVATALIVLAPEAFRALGLDARLAANIRQALFGLVLIAAMASSKPR